MKSVLEAKAICIATVLAGEPETWGKTQADAACAVAKRMLAKGEIDADTFAEVVGNVAGNHSAKRQQLQSWGLIASKEGDSAEKRAILAELKAINAAQDAELSKYPTEQGKGIRPLAPSGGN